MSRLRIRGYWVLTIVCLLANSVVGDPPRNSDKPASAPLRLDSHGDPLPEGAIARLGTLRLRQQGSISSALFLPDGKRLATAGELGTLFLVWDTTTGKEISRVRNSTGWSRLLACSPKGDMLAIAVYEDLRLWDIVAGKEVCRLRGHKGRILGGAFRDAGKEFVSVGVDAVIRWWDTRKGTLLRTWDPVSAERGKLQKGAQRFHACSRAVFSQDAEILAVDVCTAKVNGDNHPTHSFRMAVWQPGAQRELWRGREATAQPCVFTLSPDGKLLAASDGENDLAIKEATTGKGLFLLKLPPGPYSLGFAPDGKRLGITDNYQQDVRIWEFPKGRPGQAPVPSKRMAGHFLAFSPNGERLVSGLGGTLALWEIGNGKELPFFDGHQGVVAHLRFSPNGKDLISGTGPLWPAPDETITWDPASSKPRRRSSLDERFPKRSYRILLSPDHSRYLDWGKEDGAAFIRDLRTNQLLCRLDAVDKNGAGIAFSPNNRFVAIYGTKELGEGLVDKLVLLDTTTGKRVGAISTADWSQPLAFSPDNKAIARHHTDGTVEVVGIANGNRLCHLGTPLPGDPSGRQGTLQFSSDGRYLATWHGGCPDVFVWDLVTRKLHRRLPGQVQQGLSMDHVSLAFSPDGRTLAVGGMGGGNSIQLWELVTAKVRREIKGHLAPVQALAFSPDGRVLASGSVDTTVLLWDLQASPRAKQQ